MEILKPTIEDFTLAQHDHLDDKGGGLLGIDWYDYSELSTIVGWSDFSTKQIYVAKLGRTVFVMFYLAGTSDSTGSTFTVPYTVNDLMMMISVNVRRSDNDGTEAVGLAIINNTTKLCTLYSTLAKGAWTASGHKRIQGQFFYESAV